MCWTALAGLLCAGVLKDALKEWLAHRREVLVRRSRHRLGKIQRRLEILDGYLIVFLNLYYEVIAIIRESDPARDDPMAEGSA